MTMMYVFLLIILATWWEPNVVSGSSSVSSLQELELKVAYLVSKQEIRNDDVERKLEMTVMQNEDLEGKLETLAMHNEELRVRNEDLEQKVEKLDQQMKTLQGFSRGAAARDHSSMHNVSQLATELPSDQDVAFSVALPSHQYPTSHQRAPFETVFVNYGDAFDVTNHQFVAPVDGIYYFTVSVITYSYHYALMYLYHNDVLKMHLFERDNTASSDTGAANSIMLQLQEGDTVHVDMYGHSSISHMYLGSTSYCYTSFNGMLLFTL